MSELGERLRALADEADKGKFHGIGFVLIEGIPDFTLGIDELSKNKLFDVAILTACLEQASKKIIIPEGTLQ